MNTQKNNLREQFADSENCLCKSLGKCILIVNNFNSQARFRDNWQTGKGYRFRIIKCSLQLVCLVLARVNGPAAAAGILMEFGPMETFFKGPPFSEDLGFGFRPRDGGAVAAIEVRFATEPFSFSIHLQSHRRLNASYVR